MWWPTTVLLLLGAIIASSRAQFNTCFNEPAAAPPTSFNFSGVDAFGLRLFSELAGTGGDDNSNLMLSPFSIWSALSLALLGSQGNTLRQLQTALNLPSSKLAAYRAKYALDFVLNAAGSGTDGSPDMLRVDRAYFDTSLNVKRCVSNVIHNVDIINFRDATATLNKINRDVSIGTGGHIKDFLTPNAVVNSVFVLINAIYFKGTWETKFDIKDTTKQVFYNHKGVQIATADMMTQQGNFNIVNSPALGATVLELPYYNSNFSMFVILPNITNPNVAGVLRSLNSYTLGRALNAMQKLPVKMFLPKFDLKTEVGSELVSTLQNMKITDMFDPSVADFTDFSSVKPLAADSVKHQAKVAVDETGTTAAAATAIIGTRSGPASKVFQFVANRPFIFIIYEKRIKVSIFTGVVKNPTK